MAQLVIGITFIITVSSIYRYYKNKRDRYFRSLR